MNGICGKWAWVHPTEGVSRFFCGRGNCTRPKCHDLVWSRRVMLITALIKEYGLIRFFTLTLDPDMIPSSINAWDYIQHPWSKLRKRIKRLYPEFRFVAILEKHKTNNRPHIHGFTNSWISQLDWSIMWNGCKGGKIVWVEKVKDGDVSSYVSKELEVAKYVGKENLVSAYKEKKGHRTLWRSEKLKAKFELTSSPEWSIIKQDVYTEQGELTDFYEKKGKIWHQKSTPKERPGDNMRRLS